MNTRRPPLGPAREPVTCAHCGTWPAPRPHNGHRDCDNCAKLGSMNRHPATREQRQ
jgi:hypothetical protein